MPEEQMRFVCEKAGCALLLYREAAKAVVQLPDCRKIAVKIERGQAWVQQTHGFVDTLIEVPVICSWNLAILPENACASFRPSRTAFASAVLDTLIERLAQCDTLFDVINKAAVGALDPIEAVDCRFDAMTQALRPTDGVCQTGVA